MSHRGFHVRHNLPPTIRPTPLMRLISSLLVLSISNQPPLEVNWLNQAFTRGDREDCPHNPFCAQSLRLAASDVTHQLHKLLQAVTWCCQICRRGGLAADDCRSVTRRWAIHPAAIFFSTEIVTIQNLHFSDHCHSFVTIHKQRDGQLALVSYRPAPLSQEQNYEKQRLKKDQ